LGRYNDQLSMRKNLGLADDPFDCKACPKGRYNDQNAGGTLDSACTKCGTGKYNQNTYSQASSACLDCPAGKYAPTEGNNCLEASSKFWI
jgi:hypothetical protein